MVAVRQSRRIIRRRVRCHWSGQNVCHRLVTQRASASHTWLRRIPAAHELNLGHVSHGREGRNAHAHGTHTSNHAHSVHQPLNRSELAGVDAACHAGIIPPVVRPRPVVMPGVDIVRVAAALDSADCTCACACTATGNLLAQIRGNGKLNKADRRWSQPFGHPQALPHSPSFPRSRVVTLQAKTGAARAGCSRIGVFTIGQAPSLRFCKRGCPTYSNRSAMQVDGPAVNCSP